MNISSELLCEIHRIHRQLSELGSRLSRGPRQIAAGENIVRQREAELVAAKDALTKTRMAADQKELQLKEREGHIEDMKRKLNECSNNREYQAFMERIAADEQANSVLSDEILELYDKVTLDQKAVVESESRLTGAKAETDKVRKRIEDERESLERDVGRLSQALKEAEEQLPSDIRPEYERLVKSKGEEALAPLEGECCGGCYQQITPQMIDQLRLSAFVLCKACGCIMYQPEDRKP